MSLARSNLNEDKLLLGSKEVSTFDYGHGSKGGNIYDMAYRSSLQTQTPVYRKPVSVNCGELSPIDVHLFVQMAGRVQHQKVERFLMLHDSHGSTQLVLENDQELRSKFRSIPSDSHIEITGIVQLRPKTTINTAIRTGEIEVNVHDVKDVFTPKRKLAEIENCESFDEAAKKARTTLIPLNALELPRCVTNAAKKKFQQRTHNCSMLNKSHVGSVVSISGWLVDKRKNGRFSTLEDGFGHMELLFFKSEGPVFATFKKVEVKKTLINVKGIVKKRPKSSLGKQNDVEVEIRDIEIIDPNEPDSEDPNTKQESNSIIAQPSDHPSSGSIVPGNINSYCYRTHTCGELRGGDIGKNVVLCGWLSSVISRQFALIRDGHGATHCAIPVELKEVLSKEIEETPPESVIMVSGSVVARPPDLMSKNNLATWKIVVMIQEYKVLNYAKKSLPFITNNAKRPKKDQRMKYRYLDLRFEDMQYNLRMRSKVLMKMREFLINHRGFVEVETPTLVRRTPWGAQEFVVPTRTKGKFYSLVESPQQLKQLLMVGSMDRYFQVARCYRDEEARPDKQPEFTQMDIELSFTDREKIMALIEDLLKASFPKELTPVTPFPIIKYKEAMHWYGTDKPDTRFDKKLMDISDLIEDESSLPANTRNIKDFTAKVLVFDSSCDQNQLKYAICKCERLHRLKGCSKSQLIVVNCSERWKEAIKASLPFLLAEELKRAIEFPIPSTIVVGVGSENEILPPMGKLRLEMFQKPSTDLKFAWIVDFPLFLEKENGTLVSAHHPFTQANEEDVQLNVDPLKVRSLHFDLVLNGHEVGGGSMRNHNSEMQTKILTDFLKIPTDSVGHLLEALDSGAPPHGGIALGIDRLISIMVGANCIREVIAFPKGMDGKDPLSCAPCSISYKEKKLYHLIGRSPK